MTDFISKKRYLANQGITAALNPLEFQPTYAGENYSAAVQQGRLTGQLNSPQQRETRAMQEQIEQLNSVLGEDLEEGDFFGVWAEHGRTSDFVEQFGLDLSPDALNPFTYGVGLERRLKNLDAFVDRMREENPEFADVIPDANWRRTRADEIGKEAEAKRSDVSARAASGRAVLAGIGGDFAGAATSPETLLTLPFGAGARAGILATMRTEALIAAGTETAIQPFIQTDRANLGLEAGFKQGATDVAFATGGAAVLAGGLKAFWRGGETAYKKAFNIPSEQELTDVQRVAAAILAEEGRAMETNPGAAADLPQHHRLLDSATDAIARGDTPGIEPSLQEEAQAAVQSFVGEDPLQASSALRVFRGDELNQIKIDAERFQFKEGGDEFGVTDRLQGITRWHNERAGTVIVWEAEDGGMFIADGHQRLGLAQRIRAQNDGQDVEINAFVLREADGVVPEEAKVRAAIVNIAQGTGTAVDAAKVLRNGPPELLEDLPTTSALVKTANGLRDLGDDAFGMVINDIVDPVDAAAVGRAVDDPDVQMAILGAMAKHKGQFGNEFERVAFIRELAASARRTETQENLFGFDDGVEILAFKRAKLLSAVSKRLKNDARTLRTLTDQSDTIEGVGKNKLDRSANQSELERAQEILTLLSSISTRAGPISDAINAATARFADGETNLREATRQILDALPDAVRDERSGGAGGRAATGRPRPSPADDALQEEPNSPAEATSLEIGETDIRGALQPEAEPATTLTLGELVANGADRSVIDSHPDVVSALDRMAEKPETSAAEGYDSDEWHAARQYKFGDETVTGTEEALERWIDGAERLAAEEMGVEAQPVRAEFEAVIILGPPAAGKSTIANEIALARGAAIVDSDEIKKTIPEYDGGVGASAVHEESSSLIKAVENQFLEDGTNIVLPKVGGNAESIRKTIAKYQERGYVVSVVNMAVSPENAYQRMIGRFVSTGRIIPPSYVDAVGDRPSAVYRELKQEGEADGYAEIDNNGGRTDAKRTNEISGQNGLRQTNFDLRPGGGEGTRSPEPSIAENRQAGSETTPAGEQTLIDGVAPITDADRAQARADAPIDGGAAEADSQIGGLFDPDDPARSDLFDSIEEQAARREELSAMEVYETNEDGVPGQSQTVTAMLDELEAEQDFLEQLKLCDRSAT